MDIIFGIVCFITAAAFGIASILIVQDILKGQYVKRELLFVYFFAAIFAFWAVAMVLFGSWLIFTY
jgi:hypothetical protein